MSKKLYIAYHIIKHIKKLNKKGKTMINTFFSFKTWSRASHIIPSMTNFSIHLYNGLCHFPIYINEYMYGYKLGEFVITRKLPKHNIPTIKEKNTYTLKEKKNKQKDNKYIS